MGLVALVCVSYLGACRIDPWKSFLDFLRVALDKWLEVGRGQNSSLSSQLRLRYDNKNHEKVDRKMFVNLSDLYAFSIGECQTPGVE